MENVLVTGGHGLLGTYVVDELAGGFSVTVADRQDGPYGSPHGPVDVLDLDALASCMRGVDAVVHLAAVDAAVEAPDHAYFHTNVLATWNVLHCGFEAGVRRFVLCSSSSAYGIRPFDYPGVPRTVPLDESHPLLASDPYGLSKRVSETIAKGFAARPGMSIAVLRPCFVAFPGLVDQMGAAYAAGPNRPATGEAGSLLPPLGWFVAPQDAARCFRAALEARVEYEVFNVSAEDTFNATPTLDRIRELFHGDDVPADHRYFENNPHCSPLRCDKAHRHLGWAPRINWGQLRENTKTA